MIRILAAVALSLVALTARAEIEITEVTSPGGIDAWLVEEPAIPFVALEIVIEGGANLDQPGKRGAVNLMMALLEEGSGDMDARTFQQAREGLAASYGFEANDDSVAISARYLSDTQDEAIGLLRQALTRPTFDADAIERVRAQVQSILRSEQTDPNEIGSKEFNALAYGDHPYGSSLNGTPETVAGLTRDDLLAAHARVLNRADIHVAAVGDITAEELGAVLDDLLGALPAEAPEGPGDVEFGLPGGVTVVEFETPQSVALFGHAGIDRDSEDFFAAYILNEILGGSGIESRLFEEVREKRGLTYGVYSYLVSKEHSDVYLGSVASANDRIADAITVIRDEWARMARIGVTAEELDEAKTYLTGAYPLRFDGNARIANILVGMQMQDLDKDYILTRNDRINAVTLEEINRVASDLLDPEALHFVVVGQPAGLGPSQ